VLEKTPCLKRWKSSNSRVQRVVAYTTRQPRHGEVDGVDYHFISRQRFDELVEDGAFLEHKIVHGNCYATPLAEMQALLVEGKIAVLKIDVQGAMEAMRLRPEALSIFLLPPTVEDLEKRIRGRGKDSEGSNRGQIGRRSIRTVPRRQIRCAYVNDDIERVVRELNDLT